MAVSTVNPEGTQDRKGCLPLPSVTAAPPQWSPWGDSGWEAQSLCWPRQLRCISKKWFQWAQTLHLPIDRKVLNSLTEVSGFLLANNNILMFWPLAFIIKLLYIPAPPCLFGAKPQSESGIEKKKPTILNFQVVYFFPHWQDTRISKTYKC